MFGICCVRGGSVLLTGEIYTQGYLIAMAICGFLVFQPVQAIDWMERLTWLKVVILIVLFCLSLMTMFVQAFNPFLYFQF